MKLTSPEFEDSNWEISHTTLYPNEMPESGWTGIGWFRVHLSIDSTLRQKTLGLYIQQAGNSEIYLDGELHAVFGKSERQQEWKNLYTDDYPREISFDGKGDHVIAVRYSNASVKKFHTAGFPAGFSLYLEKMSGLVKRDVQAQQYSKQQMFLLGLLILIIM